jgi:hypothetical protein
MAGGPVFTEFTPNQRQAYQDAAATYQAFLAAWRQNRAWRGGMHWKRIRGREYLYRYRDRFGHGESLGPRSEHTEQIFATFSRGRQEAAARLRGQQGRMAEQARFCRAALLHRVPRIAAKLLRRLEQREPGGHFLVLGAPAIYAYEFAVGVFLTNPGNQDLLAEARGALTLAGGGELSCGDFMQVLRQIDRSFAPLPELFLDGCQAANRDGFRVTVLRSGSRRPGKPKAVTVPGAREPLPPEAGNLQYLTAAPKFSQVVVGQDGLPATMVAPDPRAFALHKLWLSVQEDRNAGQKTRDRRQALTVAEMVLRYLPQYDFSSSELDMFPPELERAAAIFAEGLEPVGESDPW